MEQVWTRVMTSHGALFFGATYLPPGSPPEVYDQIVSSTKSIVESCAVEDHIFLVGDFNRPTEWITDSEDSMLLRPFSCTDVDEGFLTS